MKLSEIPKITQSGVSSFTLFAGPCVIETSESLFHITERLKQITTSLEIPFVLKASYKKTNRTKFDSFNTIGEVKALKILEEVGSHFNIPTMTDVHSSYEATRAGEYGIDIIQIPAFLCRQSDILKAAADTGKVINIKKGQFMSGSDMKYAVEKVRQYGNDKILLTERGTTFGYNDLIMDMRNIPIMQSTGCPVLVDVTHSLGVNDGNPNMIRMFAKMAVVCGAEGLFLETHPSPRIAKSDGSRMLMLNNIPELLRELLTINK